MKRMIDIGFIGLGNMGRPMAARLAEAGFNLTVFDLNSRVLKSFCRQYRAKPAAAAGQAGRNNQAVITMLPDPEGSDHTAVVCWLEEVAREKLV